MKKLVLIGLCAILCFQMTACGGLGAAEKKKEEALALLSSNKLESGEFVIDGVKHSFPAGLSDWTGNGWHISNRYDNADTFELEYNIESNEFELFNDEKDSEYVTVCGINLGMEPVKLEQSLTSYVEVDISKGKDDMFVVLPGGITCESTKEDVIAAYGEPVEEEDSYLCYTYTNADGIDILVGIRVAYENVDKVFYKMADSNWGSVTNAEECAQFINDALKASFYGDYASYVEKKFDTEEGAQLLYEGEVEYYANSLMYYLDVDYQTVSDEIAAGFYDAAKEVLGKAKWDMPVVDLSDGATYGSFEITMYPMDFLYIILDGAQAVADSGVEGDEYAQGMLDAVNAKVSEVSYLEPVTMTYDINLDDGVVAAEDWSEIDDILMDFME